MDKVFGIFLICFLSSCSHTLENRSFRKVAQADPAPVTMLKELSCVLKGVTNESSELVLMRRNFNRSDLIRTNERGLRGVTLSLYAAVDFRLYLNQGRLFVEKIIDEFKNDESEVFNQLPISSELELEMSVSFRRRTINFERFVLYCE